MLKGPAPHNKVSSANQIYSSLVHHFLQGFSKTDDCNNQIPRRINPNRIALRYQGKELTFHDLDKISTEIASFLRRKFELSLLPPVYGKQEEDFIIAICAPPSDKLVLTLFAILKLGAAYMPIDAKSCSDRITKIVNLTRPDLVIVEDDPRILEKFGQCVEPGSVVSIKEIWESVQNKKRVKWALDVILVEKETREFQMEENYDFDKMWRKFQVQNFQNRENEEDDGNKTAIVMFTSGSTGDPKGVRLSHKTILNRLEWQWTEFPFGSKGQENCCLKTALTFVDSVPEIFGPLLQGHSLTIFNRREVTQPHIFAQKICDSQITQLILVPSLLRTLLTIMELVDERHESGKVEVRPLDSVKLWICSGEPLTQDLIVKFFKYFDKSAAKGKARQLCNFYGSTEIMDVTFHTFNSMKDLQTTMVRSLSKCDSKSSGQSLPNQIPLGKPLWNTVIYVLNSNLELAGDGEIGEIYAAGCHVGKGYLGDAAMNGEKYLPFPTHLLSGDNKTDSHTTLYRTGDFGWIKKMPNGQRSLFYAGRVDSQIKVRGHRVDLSEIQRLIDDLKEFVKESIVLCYRRDGPEQSIVAFIVPVQNLQLQERVFQNEENLEDKIVKVLKSKLLEYQLPVVSIIHEIPLLVHGKTDRQKLLRDYHQQQINRKVNLNFINSRLSLNPYSPFNWRAR